METLLPWILSLVVLYVVLGFGVVGVLVLPGLLLPRLQKTFPAQGRALYRAHDYATALVSARSARRKFNATPQELRAALSRTAYGLALFYVSAWYGFYLVLIPLFVYAYAKIV